MTLPWLNRLLAELRRRKVLRLAAIYVLGAWLILQVADVLLEIVAAPEGSLRAIAIVLGLGFPLAVLLSWIYDLTPAGLVRTGRGDFATESSTLRWSWPWLGLGILLAAAGLSAFLFIHREAEVSSAPELSVAVLPFMDLSLGGENTHFGDGLAGELVDSLARLPGMQVAARTSSFAYREPGLDVREIARVLQVSNVVEGTVRRVGGELRIAARLVDGRTGRGLWSANFEVSIEEIFSVQEQIARSIAEALGIGLKGDETLVPAATVDAEAYENYLRGRAELRGHGTLQHIERAIGHFEVTLRSEPAFAPALAGLCAAHWEKYAISRDAEIAYRAIDVCRGAEAEESSVAEVAIALSRLYRGTGQEARALALLERAAAEHPRDAGVHAALGETHVQAGDLEAAVRHHMRAVDLDPSYWRYHWMLGRTLFEQGRLDEAGARMARAIWLEPDSPAPYSSMGAIHFQKGEFLLAGDAFRQSIARQPNPVAYANAGTNYFYGGDFEQAEEMFRMAVQLNSADFRYHGFLADAIDVQGVERFALAKAHYDEAIRLGYEQLAINPMDDLCRAGVASFLARVGRTAEARRELETVESNGQHNMLVRRNLAMARLFLGDEQGAIREFSAAVADGYPPALLASDPRLAALKEKPEFMALLTR